MAAGRAVPVFSGVSQPFYSVTFRVDVTNLHAYTKARGISFYYALGYLVTDAVNSVVNFRYTIRDGEVWLLDKRIPSLTDLKPGSEQFHIVTLPKTGTLDEFCCAAKAKSAAQQSFLDQDCETDALIYISTTPWFDLTSCTNERDFDKDDAIPRITWGKFVPENGRETRTPQGSVRRHVARDARPGNQAGQMLANWDPMTPSDYHGIRRYD